VTNGVYIDWKLLFGDSIISGPSKAQLIDPQNIIAIVTLSLSMPVFPFSLLLSLVDGVG